MVNRSTVTATRLLVLAGLGAILGGCATEAQKPIDVVEDTTIGTRFDEQAFVQDGYTAVVPRAFVDDEDVGENAPDTYTVVRGDTLWDISGRFLKEPWLWPTVWDYNPQIANPHLIYPGDKIALEYVDGRPTLTISREGHTLPVGTAGGVGADGFARTGAPLVDENGKAVPVERLSPRIRSESLDNAIPMIPGDSIHQFLVHPKVVPESVIDKAPYVVANHDGHLISAVGHKVYARGRLNREQPQYGIYRRSDELRDPVTNRLLGYEVVHVADARLLNIGDPSILGITSNNMETMAGDILLPSNTDAVSHTYFPRMPEIRGEGRIVSLVNAISQAGRDQVVVLNLGKKAGIQEGDVLAIESRGGDIVDPRGRWGFERVELPNDRTGVLMVFRAYDTVSYGLVMESNRPVMINDIITGI